MAAILTLLFVNNVRKFELGCCSDTKMQQLVAEAAGTQQQR